MEWRHYLNEGAAHITRHKVAGTWQVPILLLFSLNEYRTRLIKLHRNMLKA